MDYLYCYIPIILITVILWILITDTGLYVQMMRQALSFGMKGAFWRVCLLSFLHIRFAVTLSLMSEEWVWLHLVEVHVHWCRHYCSHTAATWTQLTVSSTVSGAGLQSLSRVVDLYPRSSVCVFNMQNPYKHESVLFYVRFTFSCVALMGRYWQQPPPHPHPPHPRLTTPRATHHYPVCERAPTQTQFVPVL